jgi:hypothetical protein
MLLTPFKQSDSRIQDDVNGLRVTWKPFRSVFTTPEAF